MVQAIGDHWVIAVAVVVVVGIAVWLSVDRLISGASRRGR